MGHGASTLPEKIPLAQRQPSEEELPESLTKSASLDDAEHRQVPSALLTKMKNIAAEYKKDKVTASSSLFQLTELLAKHGAVPPRHSLDEADDQLGSDGTGGKNGRGKGLAQMELTGEETAHLSHPHFGVIKVLIEVIGDYKGVAREHACGALSNIVQHQDHDKHAMHSIFVNYKDHGLVQTMMLVLEEEASGETRLRACQVLRMLAAEECDRADLGAKELGLVPVLVAMVTDQPVPRTATYNKRSTDGPGVSDDNKAKAKGGGGSMALLIKSAVAAEKAVPSPAVPIGKDSSSCKEEAEHKSEHGGESNYDNRDTSVLTVDVEAAAAATATATDASPALSGYVRVSPAGLKEARAACGALRNLFINERNCMLWAPTGTGVVPALVEKLRDCSDEDTKSHILMVLDCLTFPKVNAAFLGSRDLGLIDLLMDLFISHSESLRVRKEATDALVNLCNVRKNMVIMSKMTPKIEAMLETFLDVFVNDAYVKLQEEVLRFLFRYSRLTVDSSSDRRCTNILQIVDERLGLLPVLMKSLTHPHSSPRVKLGVVYLAVHIARFASDLNVMQLVNNALHVYLVEVLELAGADRDGWEARGGEIVFASISALLQLSTRRIVRPLLKRENIIDVVRPIMMLDTNEVEALNAGLIVALLVGHDEPTQKSHSVLHSKPETMQRILGIYSEILDGKDGYCYSLGTFELETVIGACQSMTLSDKNKTLLADGPLLGLLIRTVRAFLDSTPPFDPEFEDVHVPGVECAELAVETLLQLSFAYPDDVSLRQFLMPPQLGVVGLLDAVLRDGRISAFAQQHASFLRSRLHPDDASITLTPTDLNRLDSQFTYAHVEVDDDAEDLDDWSAAGGGGGGAGGTTATNGNGADCSALSLNSLVSTSLTAPASPGKHQQQQKKKTWAGSLVPRYHSHVVLLYCSDSEAHPEFARDLTQALRSAGYDIWTEKVSVVAAVCCIAVKPPRRNRLFFPPAKLVMLCPS